MTRAFRVRQRRRHARMLGVPGIAVFAAMHPMPAQGVRITGTTSIRYFELLPLAQDSVPVGQTVGTGSVRDSPAGPVSCAADAAVCYFYRSTSRAHTLPLTQDIQATGWGLGAGVSAHAHIRLRETAGGAADLYPRQDDRFDALAAYLEIDRSKFLARAGRQWLTSQLGFTNFDGALVSARAARSLSVQAYGGWSLVQGLSEPVTTSALSAADLLPPDKRGVLLGASARYRTGGGTAVSAEYQREIRTDRAGLYAERTALDGTMLLGRTSIDAALQLDLSTGGFNELSLRAGRPLPFRLRGSLEARHYAPYFPLWTIWGAFAPVGFDEARADASWQSLGSSLSLALDGSYRHYQTTHTGLSFLPLRNDGWHVGGTGTWRPTESWTATGTYGRDIGFGASRSDGSAGLHWSPGNRGFVGVIGTAFQTIYEFRVGSGTVTGAILDGGIRVSPDVRVVADAAIYQHVGKDTPSIVNWSQRRASLRIEWTVGNEPGRFVPNARQ